MRNDFQKADYQGENPFAKGAPRTASNAFVQALSQSKARDIEVHCWPHAQWTWTPFPKTLICLRRSDKLARDRISRTRAREAYLEVLCRRSFVDRKSLPDALRSKINNPSQN